MGALRFFYATTLGRKDIAEDIPYARTGDKLPAVMTGEEVTRFLKAIADLKMRTLFITIYAAGLRVSEAVALTTKDIDSARMVIVVRQGKGRKDRYAMLSEQLLAILRDYWRRTRPQHRLFPGADPSRPITARPCSGPAAMRSAQRGSKVQSPFTPCGIASPRISWSKASISA